ncbi:TetR/AcrR family transcriptional regulator [Nocardia tengchongensis]|uniref:TetR/AcrR family transcriptional regulator n=1 Tax=Nocardia tengchongensis TaxID=2055889 RepID=UPI0036CBDB2C
MTTRPAGLRERKKQATREALREAALRLALEQGPDNVRVEDIAEAAGVSPRTYNNYFSSRDQAIVAAVTAEREARVAAAVTARAPEVRLADAIIDAVLAEYTDPGEARRDALLLITTHQALREVFLGTTDALAKPLAAAITERLGTIDEFTAPVLAAGVAAAIRVALEQWLQPASDVAIAGFVVVSRSLSDLLRATLAPLVPALDDADVRAGSAANTPPNHIPGHARS